MGIMRKKFKWIWNCVVSNDLVWSLWIVLFFVKFFILKKRRSETRVVSTWSIMIGWFLQGKTWRENWFWSCNCVVSRPNGATVIWFAVYRLSCPWVSCILATVVITWTINIAVVPTGEHLVRVAHDQNCKYQGKKIVWPDAIPTEGHLVRKRLRHSVVSIEATMVWWNHWTVMVHGQQASRHGGITELLSK